MKFKDLLEIVEKIGKGEIAIEQLKKHYREALENEKSIKAEIDKEYTLAELKKRFYSSRSKKENYIDAFWDYLLNRFNVSGKSISYSWGEKYEDALTKVILSQTQEDVDDFVVRAEKRKETLQKALDNPETLDEFQTFIERKGKEKLTPEQKKTYDRLLADIQLAVQQREARERATIQAVELGDVEMELKTTKHTQKGTDLWVVRLNTRVEKEKYNELNRKAKQLGGYYSSFAKGGAIPGFQFTSEEAAKKFMALKEGDVKKEDKSGAKQLTVAEKFREMADRWEEEASENFNRDRKENTARRERMAKGVRDDAEKRIRTAKILRNIADGLEKGQIKYLSRIDSAVQLDALRQIWTRSNYLRFQKSDDKNKQWDKWQLDLEKDIEFLEYPYPFIDAEVLQSLIKSYGGKKGFQLIAKRLMKKADAVIRHPDKHLVVFHGSDIDDARKFVGAISNQYDKERLAGVFEKYDRIQRMGLTNLPLLRTALREYVEYTDVKTLTDEERKAREVKDMENQFRGQKIEGFFPTPEPLANELVNLADIQPGDRVLEPSAGLGHIAEIIRSRFPDADLTLIERFWPLAEALQKKDFQPIRGDFLEHQGSYDKIVMNPPFENDQDIDHVTHAFNLLAPGGRLVAIMAANKEGSNKKKAQFRELVDQYGYSQENALDAFRSSFRPTSVRTITVVLDKPETQEKQPEKQPEMKKKECPKEMQVADIHVDEARFQNRSKLNENIVAQIADNYDENQLDPVVVWDDPKDGKTYLLAGHHRLAGAKRAGRETIKTRCFEGTEKEAIAYAKELSNANRTLETPLERAALYRQKAKSGTSAQDIRKQAEKLEGKNWRYILNLAALNPDGKTVNAMLSLADSSDKTTQQNLEKIADWIGEARRTFDRLTDAHENEMYDFLLENFGMAKPSISRKDVWIDRINGIVQSIDFDPANPLNLKRIQYKTQGESEYERQMAEIDEKIKDAEAKKQEWKDRFNKPTHPKYVSPKLPDYDTLQKNADKQIEKIDAELKALRSQKLDLAQKKGQMIQGGMAQLDIFATGAKDVDSTVNEIRRRQRKEERKEDIVENFDRAQNEDDYIRMVRTKLERAKNDQVELSEAQVIELGIMIQPLVQKLPGILVDMMSTNKRVLAPTFNNLLRWAQKPGRYDLVGVDIARGAKPTVLARTVKRARIFNLLGLK